MLQVSRKLIVLAAAAVALVAAYAAAGFWLVPKILRDKVEAFASESYGREVEIGKIRFNPFTFELAVDGFSFPDADGAPLASFEKLLVNLELSSLWRVGASFKEISIDRPYIRPVIRADGELNFADLAKPFPETPTPDEPEEPPRLFIELFRLTDGHAHFEDRTLATPYATDFRPLSFELRDFSTVAGSDNAYDLHAQAGTGATLDWSGDFSLSPLASAGRFKFANIDLTRHWSYAREDAGFDVSSGTVGFDGDYDFSAGQAGTQLTFNLRELGIDELGIRRIGEDTDTARFARLTLANFAFDLAKNAANVEKVRADGGSVQVWRDADGIINLERLTEPVGATAPPAATAAARRAAACRDGVILRLQRPGHRTAGPRGPGGGSPDRARNQVDARSFPPAVTGYSTAPGTTIGIVTETQIDKSASLNADLRYALDEGQLEGAVKLAALRPDHDPTLLRPLHQDGPPVGRADDRPRRDAVGRWRLRGGRADPGRQAPLRRQGTAGRLHEVGSACGRRASATTAARRSCGSRPCACARRMRASSSPRTRPSTSSRS